MTYRERVKESALHPRIGENASVILGALWIQRLQLSSSSSSNNNSVAAT